jgi:hypothetical protein
MVPAAAPTSFSLQDPARFLRALASTGSEFDLSTASLVELFALAGLAAWSRADGVAGRSVAWGANSNAERFARAVGFEEVVAGVKGELQGEAGRTVRLSRVDEEEAIRPVAYRIAELLSANDPARAAAALTIEYVMVELLRNVLQHSDDLLGAVVGAQRNDRGRHQDRPVFQVAVADNGVGIRRSLSRTHPEVQEDDVAIEQSLWPYHSGAFAPGSTGGRENAGLGLFYISEMAKALDGRLLVASGEASLLIAPDLPQRMARLPVGYPGTLVAFEIAAESSRDFTELFEEISALAQQRTPRRTTSKWLRFEAAPERVQTFLVNTFVENNEAAQRLVQQQLLPRLLKQEPVALNFVNVRVCTQSFAHALLFDALRLAWARQTPIYIANAVPVVRSALLHVEAYSQGG